MRPSKLRIPWMLTWLPLFAAACSSDDGAAETETSAAASTSTATSASDDTDASPPGTDAASSDANTSGVDTTTMGTSDGADSTGGGLDFDPETCAPEVPPLDVCDVPLGDFIGECSTFEQACPDGQRCTHMLDDEGIYEAWCAPVARNPVAVGEPCTIELLPEGGVDNCETGALCSAPLGSTEGHCVELCGCSPESPTCDTPNAQCFLFQNFGLCVDSCNPLDPSACLPGEGCYPRGNAEPGFICAPTQLSEDGGRLFESCEFLNACAPGMFCLPPESHPACADLEAPGCCVPVCSVGGPATCTDGTRCQPYQLDLEDACWTNIGVCAQ